MGKKFKLGVIGAGFMATAIISGVISSNVLDANEIAVSDLNAEALEKLAKKGVCTTQDNFELVNSSEFVLFAVKPQSLNAVLDAIKTAKCEKFISIMAGVKKDKIKSVFGDSCVARCMPNTPCAIGCGAIGIDCTDFKDEKDIKFVENLFKSIAEVVFLPEEKMNAVTGISGSSPAYFYLFLKGIIEAGVKYGIEFEDARKLATATMIGAGKMVLNNPDKTLDELINAVCSKGGTTIEAIKTYNECGLSLITEKAIDACIKRASELEKL